MDGLDTGRIDAFASVMRLCNSANIRDLVERVANKQLASGVTHTGDGAPACAIGVLIGPVEPKVGNSLYGGPYPIIDLTEVDHPLAQAYEQVDGARPSDSPYIDLYGPIDMLYSDNDTYVDMVISGAFDDDDDDWFDEEWVTTVTHFPDHIRAAAAIVLGERGETL